LAIIIDFTAKMPAMFSEGIQRREGFLRMNAQALQLDFKEKVEYL